MLSSRDLFKVCPNINMLMLCKSLHKWSFSLSWALQMWQYYFQCVTQEAPKAYGLLFVNIDKEVKNGDIAKARVCG